MTSINWLSKLFCILVAGISLFAQTGSVALKDTLGTTLSTHANISGAYNAIVTPMTQAFIIEILPAYDGSGETFPITLTAKAGSSASNYIIIRPALGNTGEVISGTSATPIVLFDDADFVIFDGRPGGVGTAPDLIVQNFSTTSGSYTFRLLNGATNNVIKYCNILNGTAATAGPRTIEFGTSVSNPSGNSNNLISHCVLDGGRSGIGFAGTSANPNSDNRIEYTSIMNFGYAGIWMISAARSTTVEYCSISQTSSSTSSLMYGFNIAASASMGDNVIRKCKIFNIQSTSSSTSLAIRGIYGTIGAGSSITIENNFISLPLDNLNGTIIGIHLLGTTDYSATVVYNTVRIAGTHGTGIISGMGSAGIFKALTGDTTSYTQKNNICINERTGGSGVHVGSCIIPGVTVLNVDYNSYYSTGTGSPHAGWDTQFFTELGAYQTAAAGQEVHSKFHNASFVSATDLHLTGASNGDNELGGTPIQWITTDIDGDVRGLVVPYMGADEASIPLGGPPAPITVLSPNGGENWLAGTSKNITWASTGITNVAIKYTTDNGTNWLPVAASVPAAGGTFAWTVPATPSTQCKVRVSNAAADTTFDVSNAVFTISTQQIINVPMTMAAGWNMTSVPVAAPDMTATVLYAGANSQLFAYNNGYVTQTTLTNGTGYWVRYPAAANFTISGTAVAGTTVPLVSGWNMIGPYHNDVVVANITTTPANIINSNFFTFNNGYIIPTSLLKGAGYWVRTSAAGVMNLPATAAKLSNQQPAEQDWNKLVISDADGNSSALYIAAYGADVTGTVLPPIPPAGIFDARFASGNMAEVLGIESKNVSISSARYPVTITANGFALLVRDKATGGKVFCQTIPSGGSAKISDPSVTVLELSAPENPVSYELFQNYPNPFNPATSIKFGIPERSRVTLSVFNQLGERVAVLLDGEYDAGFQTITWNASTLTSGIYFYELRTEKYSAVRKLMLMK